MLSLAEVLQTNVCKHHVQFSKATCYKQNHFVPVFSNWVSLSKWCKRNKISLTTLLVHSCGTCLSSKALRLNSIYRYLIFPLLYLFSIDFSKNVKGNRRFFSRLQCVDLSPARCHVGRNYLIVLPLTTNYYCISTKSFIVFLQNIRFS